ncbi:MULTISPECIES: type II toxin-antitoxin system RelE family toxin [unclassified Pseudomonas]|uniref:type II toxin-antitoxin system RelE family toxin n=1 Tax=unclassified Pseudomonas TaxID=196821 RepID=UPI0021C940F8|nr:MULTISPECIES: type II toxin-antitoxin system RelE/ParE family toxin [unclassified Pseudomonas]MCU1733510.1 type II toxin-antitoxin system RelE/ParE family toxin [Pseudomonas sp. 20P_3.2_Bac4]MCU1746477.1 type II toxin-antitoxin system RelE/ParE family toxin [Pseudomonas sp. 20P_3.2_Bac5]
MSSSRTPKDPATDYWLEFNLKARKEFDQLDASIRLQLAKKLKSRLAWPRVEADKLAGMPDCYKIKLQSIGYRLVYQVLEDRLVVLVIAVGKRERNQVYGAAAARITH